MPAKMLEQLRADVVRTAVRVYAAKARRMIYPDSEPAAMEWRQARTAHDLAVALYVLACRRANINPLAKE